MAKNEWDEFPQASPLDVALQAEGVTGAAADVARSIYEQESGSGRNTKTSNAGAVGGMQIIPTTFARVADKGWDINDPIHNARAGVRYVKALHERGGGDPALTASGYYGGEGGQDKAKMGIAVSDPRNPNAPNTLEYGKQVTARLPSAGSSTPAPGASVDEWSAFPEVKAAPGTTGGEPSKAPAARSWIEELGHQLGLTARAAVTGAASIPAMAADALIVAPANVALSAYDKAVGNKDPSFRLKPQAQALNDVMTSAGVAVPETATERVVQDAASSVAGAGSMVKGGLALAKYAGGPVTKGVGEVLAAGPKLQLASAATGAGASGVVREGGGGEGAQIAAGLAGALAPGLAGAVTKGATRLALRGGEAGRQKVEDTIKAFDAAAETTPTLGQATGSRAIQAAETGLTNMVGSSGVMVRRGEIQSKALDDSVKKLSEALAPNASGMEAGAAITSGVRAFRDSVKTTQQRLYSQLDNHIPSDTRITSERTQAALADLNTDIAGAPELSKWFKNARIQGIEGGLKSDTGSIEAVLSRPGMKEQVANMKGQLESDAARIAAANAERSQLGMKNLEAVPSPAQIQEKINGFLTQQIDSRLPYESVKKLRTLVGRELSDTSLASDVPRSKWRALYGALSDDLGDAAKAAGPKAEQVWSRANKYTKAAMERMEQLDNIVKSDVPEKVFKAATSGISEGGTTIRRVMQSIPIDNRREVAAAVLQRLGRAKNGLQNEVSDVFSSESFLTNLAAMSPTARKAFFDSSGFPGLGEKITQMGRMASVRREGAKVFANPSGTARQAVLAGWAATLGTAIMTGNVSGIATALALPAAANGLARVATGPAVVKFAAGKNALNPGVAAVASKAAADAGMPRESFNDFPVVEQAPGAAPATPVQTQDASSPTELAPAPRIELNGMATPDPEGLVDGQDAPIEGDNPEAVPSVDTNQADYDPATAFTSEPRPDGTLAIVGDTQAMRDMLVKAGIPARSLTAMKDGLLIGRTQAAKVQQAIERMQAAAAPAPQETQDIGGQVDALADDGAQDQNPAMVPIRNDALALADIAQPATQSIANVQDQQAQQAPIGAQTEAPPTETATAMAGDAATAPGVPGTGSPGGLQTAGLGGQMAMQAPAGQGAGVVQDVAPSAQAQPPMDPMQAMAARIQRLHDSGETEVAGMLQKSFDREQARVTAPAELAAMRDTAPDLPHHQSQEFARTYAQLRNTGAKPAEAAARAGLLAAVTEQAPAIGLPQKAMSALSQQLGKMPLEDAPGFAQRFIAGLIKRGVMQDFQGSDQVGAMLVQSRDGAMHAMADSVYRAA